MTAFPGEHTDDEPELGGDPACWLDRVCPACGRLVESGRTCPACGTPLDDPAPGGAEGQ